MQLSDKISHKVWESVHRLRSLDQRPLSLLVDSPHPRAQCLLVDEECSCCLLARPATGSLDLQDAHALDGSVEGAAARRQPISAGILDFQFLPKQSDFGSGPVEFGLEPVSRKTAGRSPAPRKSQSGCGEGHGMEQGRLDVMGPASGQRDRLPGRLGSHPGAPCN